MNYYQLESGTLQAQGRYEEICESLSTTGTSRYRSANLLHWDIPEVAYTCQQDVISLLLQYGALSVTNIQDHLRHKFQIAYIKRAIKALRADGMLVSDGRKLHLLDTAEEPHPLDVGAPIVFMPGLKSQQAGEIVRIQHLQSHGVDAPVAQLANGNQVFVQPQTASVDLTQMQDVKIRLCVVTYIHKNPHCTRNAIMRMLREAGITYKLSPILAELVKDKTCALQQPHIGDRMYRITGTPRCDVGPSRRVPMANTPVSSGPTHPHS